MIDERKRAKLRRTVIVVLAALLAVSLAALAGVTAARRVLESRAETSTAPDNVITSRESAQSDGVSLRTLAARSSSSDAYAARLGRTTDTVTTSTDKVTISLYSGQGTVAEPFSVENMFPGDKIYRTYQIKVSHRGTVTLKFDATVTGGDEILADKLKCTIEINDKSWRTSTFSQLSSGTGYTLTGGGATTDTLNFKITVSLPTDADNRYENKSLTADFIWTVEVDDGSTGGSEGGGGGGDHSGSDNTGGGNAGTGGGSDVGDGSGGGTGSGTAGGGTSGLPTYLPGTSDEDADASLGTGTTPGTDGTTGTDTTPGTDASVGTLPGINTSDHFAYIVGYPDGSIYPEKTITRAEVATIFFRVLTDESRAAYWSQVSPYFDVAASSWYNNAISTLTNAGVLNGKPGNVFCPDQPITRAEFAAMASRFFDPYVTVDSAPFTDIQGHWAEAEINLAYSHGLITGYSDGTFRPDQSITRAEAMTIMNRLLARDPQKEHLLEQMIYWPDNMDESAWYYAQVQEATNSHDYTRGTDCTDVWTGLLAVRDWAALEKEWSQANSVSGYGEVNGGVLDTSVTTLDALGGTATLTQASMRSLGEDGGLRVLFSDCLVDFDGTSLAAISDQTDGDASVSVALSSGAALSAAQQAALSPYQTVKIVSATVSDGAVTSFGDGLATISLPFTPARGTDADEYSVVYVAQDGTLEYVDSYYQDGYLTFHTAHFSDYAVVRGYHADQGKLVSPLLTDGRWLYVAVPVFLLALVALVWLLRRKGGRA